MHESGEAGDIIHEITRKHTKGREANVTDAGFEFVSFRVFSWTVFAVT
jgi:hypothetical protein